MATPAYVPLDPNSPSGPTQAPDVYSAKDLANVRALRDSVVCGFSSSVWGYTQNGGTTGQPVNRFWSNIPMYINAIHTYDGTNPFLPATIKWQWSNDGAATWADMDPGGPAALTWALDANYGWVITNVSRGAGLWPWAIQALVNSQAGYRQNGAHAALVGTAVHGLGTMSTQNANAVAITGGNIAAVNIANSYLNNFGRVYPTPPTAVPNGANWDWAAFNGAQQNINFGYNIAQILNAQDGEVRRLFVIGPGGIGIGDGAVNFQWAVGHPVWSAGDGTLINCVALNSTWVIGTTIPL